MAKEPNNINPLVRANLEAPLTMPVGEELAQEWGQMLGELATWGAVLSELHGQVYHAQQKYTAAQERRVELARRLSGLYPGSSADVLPFPDRYQPQDGNVVNLADYRQPESPEIA